jgi:hypothetical protein
MRRPILFLPLLLLLALAAKPYDPIPPDERTLAPGVTHRRIITEKGEVVNILVLSLRDGVRLLSVQAEGRYDGLEDLRSIYQRVYREHVDAQIIAAVNAGSWRPDRITPAGPVITGGVPVEMERYQQWPSLVVSSEGRAAIGTVDITARIQWKHRTVPLADVNRRATNEGIVLYNHFGGTTVPSATRPGETELQRAIRAQASIAGDALQSGDLDTAALLRDLRMSIRDKGLERGSMKIVCVPLPSGQSTGRSTGTEGFARDIAVAGETFPMRIQKMTTDTVAIPPNGFVLSLGSTRDLFSYATVGDTIRLLLSTTIAGTSDGLLPLRGVSEIVTGTPRLLRDGAIPSLDDRDGTLPDQFYTAELARTAAGITTGGDTLLLVTIDAPDSATGRHGVTIPRLAELMLSFGAWDAINLENGASSGMIVDGTPVGGTLDFREKTGNALVVMRKK